MTANMMNLLPSRLSLAARHILRLGVALLALARIAQAQSPGWGEYRQSPDNRGVVEGTLDANWSVPVGAAVRGMSVSGGVLITGADSTGQVAAIVLATGQVLWRARMPTSVHNDPVISDSIVVVTYGDLPLDTSPGGAWAFDIRDGRVLWKYPTRGALMPSPALVGDIVVLAARDDCVHGVGLRDGVRRYRMCMGSSSAMSSPKRAGNTVFFGMQYSRVVSLDARTGAIRWITRVPHVDQVGDADFALDGDALFTTGTEWGGPSFIYKDSGLLAAVRLYISALIHDSFSERHQYFSRQYVLSLAQSDGTIRWRTQVASGRQVKRNQSGTPALAGDLVVTSSPVASTLSALRPSTGAKVWQVTLPSRHRGVPTILGDTVFVGLESGQLMTYRLGNGAALGSCRWPGAFTPSAPLIVGRTFIYGASDGTLRAIPMRLLSVRLKQGGSCIS